MTDFKALLKLAADNAVYDGSYCVGCGMGDCDPDGASQYGHDDECWVKLAKEALGEPHRRPVRT